MGPDAEDLPLNPGYDTMGPASPFHLPLVKNM